MKGHIISNKYKESLSNNIFDKVVENKDEINKLKKEKINYLMYIHCNGCFRKCPLSNPYCGRGKNLKEQF